MSGPLDGIRVVELGVWVAGPSAAMILADWGADVIKVEALTGDPYRGFFRAVAGVDAPVNPMFELDNRGKRSLQVNVGTPEGGEIVAGLTADADVFVTNLRPVALKRFGLDYPDLSVRNPRLIYARITGYGEEGPDQERPTYDLGAFWSRAGIAAALTPPDSEPPYMRGGFGDHTTGLALTAGILGALYARERTSRGQLVTTSLFRTGTYIIGFDINATLRFGTAFQQPTRATMPNPLTSCYLSSDGRWIWLLGLQADRHWPDLVRAVERPQWLENPRFKDIRARAAHVGELVAELDEIFATRTFDDWAERLDRAGMWWAPVNSPEQVVADRQLEGAGAVVEVPTGDGQTVRMVSSPVDFSETTWSPRGAVPEAGQHTEEILLDRGYTWDDIANLKERGVIP